MNFFPRLYLVGPEILSGRDFMVPSHSTIPLISPCLQEGMSISLYLCHFVPPYVCPCMCPSICLSIWPSIHPLVLKLLILYIPFSDATTYLHKRSCLSVRLSVHPSICQSVRQSIHPSIHPSVRPSISARWFD